MTKSRNVDICVTCVSDKAPQLPLREELPSLGIEVVYNAQGVGVKASRHESKKLLKKFRETEHLKAGRKPTPQEEREMEEDLMIPRALSYHSYQRELHHVQKKSTETSSSASSSSSNSWETNSTLDSSDAENKLRGTGVKKVDPMSPTIEKSRKKPPRTVEIPSESPEDRAVREAFTVFSDPASNSQTESAPESRDAGTTPQTSSALRSTKSKGSSTSREPSSPVGQSTSSHQQASSGNEPSTITSQTKHEIVQGRARIGATSSTSVPSPSTSSSIARNTSSDLRSSGPSSDLRSSEPFGDLRSSGPTSHTHGTSTLSSDKDAFQPDRPKVQVHSSPATQKALPKLRLGFSSSSDDDDSTPMSSMKDDSAHSSEAREQPSSPTSPSSPTIKVSQINSPNSQASELFDLTEISDSDSIFGDSDHDEKFLFDSESTSKHSGAMSKDLSTLSSKNEPLPPRFVGRPSGVHVFPSPAIQRQLPGLRLQIPEVEDGYGRIILDLSSVCEEDVPSPDSYTDSKFEWPKYKGRGKRVIHSPHKRYSEDRQDYDIVESPTTPTRNTARFRYDYHTDIDRIAAEGAQARREGTDVNPVSLFDNTSANSKSTNDFDDVIHSPQKSHSEALAAVNYDDNDFIERPHIPMLTVRSKSPGKETAQLSPSLKNSMPKDVLDHGSPNMHVSFSQDVEEHFYREDEYRELEPQGITSYEDCFKLEERREERERREEYEDSTPGIGHNLSTEADRAFNTFLRTSDSKKSKAMPSEREELKRKAMPSEREELERMGLAALESNSFSSPESNFLNALSQESPLPEDFVEILEQNPDLARNKLPQVDLYPLHAACTRSFPNRFRGDQTCHVVDLVADVAERRKLIAAIVEADPSRCNCLNKDGDLPVHLLARRLMEWEAMWYQKVYEKAREDSENELESGAGITRLYQTMSQSIDLLLKSVSSDALLCQRPGSIGRLLPIHIAAIFTVSYDTLKALLETFEDGAKMKCNLEMIRTFIPNNTTPLELHDRLSTDFPKWEIEGTVNEDEINWTQSALDESYGTKGGMRRSDLMFAFNPDIFYYRNDKSRIWRLESRIRHELSEMERDYDYKLSRAACLLWIWMCTFEGVESDDDNYIESVERIVEPISARAVKLLASLPIDDGKPVFDKAIPQVADILRERLSKIAETEIPIPMAALSSNYLPEQNGFLMRHWEYGNASRFCLQGRGFVGPLCRTLFNITESNFPTSFVLLPYKLVKDAGGRLGLESADAANVAMQFADCLLHLTDPKILLHFMEKKSVRFLGKFLRKEDKIAWTMREAEAKELLDKLLKLYAKGPAYLYFLDEFNGVPIVPEDSSIYPLIVDDSVDMIRKVLPLMLTGMALMRGEKAISVLTKVLLDPDLECVQTHWIEAAKDILGYMYSPQTEWTSGFLQDLLPLRESLVDFVERGPSNVGAKPDRNGLSNEWVVELSLIKMVVQMHDSNHTYAGTKPKRAGPLKVLWTKERSFLNPDDQDHLFYIDFKSIKELKEMPSSEGEDSRNMKEERRLSPIHDEGRSSPDSVENVPGYELLFQELSLVQPEINQKKQNEEKDQENSETQSARERRDEMETTLALRNLEMASSERPISLLDFDDDLDLDSVLQLRILLDEQEAKLDFIKEKMADIEIEERELLDREERLGEMLNDINNAKDNLLLSSPKTQGLSRARKLLHRICDLEDRILCREVEVGQLKNEIACFDLEAEREGTDIFLFDDTDI